MKDIVESLTKYFSDRMKTPVYGIFGAWWVAFHWEFFYTLFFVDQAAIARKTGLLKNEYLRQRFYDYSHPYFWYYFGLSVVASAALTFLMIWVIPRFILRYAFEEEQEHEADKRSIKLRIEGQVQVGQAKLEGQREKREKASTQALRAAARRVEQEKKVQATDPTVLWQEEYEQFKKTNIFNDFDELIASLYQFNGEVKVERDFRTEFELSTDVLAYADANDLINYNRADNMIVSLTDKGKYFVKKFQSEA